MNQRGFIQLSMMAWGAIAAGAVILSLTGAVYVQTLRLNSCKAEYAKFVGGVEALGKAAEKAAKDQAMRDKLFKENADAENARTTATLNARIAGLRKSASSGRGSLSAPAPAAASPDSTCFDPAKLAGALRSLDEGVLGIVESGSQAVIDLDTAKEWAKAR